jgi:hypothetical protein
MRKRLALASLVAICGAAGAGSSLARVSAVHCLPGAAPRPCAVSAAPVNEPPEISLRAGQQRTFTAARAPTGTLIACFNRATRVLLEVPPVTRNGFKDPVAFDVKKGVSAKIKITRRSFNRIVVTCSK